MNIAKRSRGRALFFALLAFVVGAGSFVVGVLNSAGQRAEASVLRAAAFTTDPPPPLNLVSVSSVLLALILIGGLALAVHGIRRSLAVTVVPTVAIIASQLLKQQFLQRPGLFELDAPNTFPSGHMTVFTVIVGALLWSVPSKGRAIVAGFGGVLLAIVAWQLLAFGWHRPSDVIGSLALGVFVFACVALVSPARTMSPAILGGAISSVLVVVGIVSALIGGALTITSLLAEQNDLLLFSGELVVSGTALLTARALLALNR